MGTSKTNRRALRQAAQPRWPMGARAVALAAAAAGLAAQAQTGTGSAAAAAPATPASASEAVVVTGFRASLNSALNAKKNADGIVDVIRAEDVSKFPDANLAESLQRVPGVSLARGDGGEGKQISVRGLSAGFTRVRINGIEAISATGASDINGSTNRSRAFDFSVFAAELFSSLEVRKTSQADLEEGSLGATVDLRAARPFDFSGRTVSLSAQKGYNTLARNTAPRLTGLVSDRWDTPWGKLGALVSLAYSKRQAMEEGYEAVELLPASADGGFCSPLGYSPQSPGNDAVRGASATNCGVNLARTSDPAAYQNVFGRTDNFGGTVATPAAGSGAFHPRIPRYRRSVAEYERSGLTAAFQWRPSVATELNLDLLAGQFNNSRYDNYISAISFGRTLAAANGKPQTSIVEASFNGNGSWEYGKFNGVDVRSEGLLDVNNTRFRQHVLSGSHQLSERVKLEFMSGLSRNTLDSPQRTTVQFDSPNVNGYSFDFRNNRNVPTLNFGIDVANPSNFSWGPVDADGTVHGQFVGRVLKTGNKLATHSLGGSWEVNEQLTLKSGLSLRQNTWDNFEVSFGAPNGLANPAGFNMGSVSRLITGFGRGLEGSGFPSQWVAVDLDKFRQVWDIECNCAAVPGSQLSWLTQANRTVDEKIQAAYLSADFNAQLLGVPLRGNAGLRATDTTARSSALVNAGGTLTPVNFEKGYRDVLPALNLTAQLPRNVFVRFSAGKTLSRPEYVDLAPSAAVNVNAQTVNIGNPQLEPIRAKTFDLQAEWYYDKGAMVSLGLFHKKIDTYIQRISERVAYSTLGLPDALLSAGGCSLTGGTPACPTLPSSIVTVSRAANTPGGPLNGVEFNLQAPLRFLPGMFSNLGLLANYTQVRSNINYITRTATATLPQLTMNAPLVGMSPRARNLTLYYEDAKFSARISSAYRSKYIFAVLGDVNGHDFTWVDPSTNVDFSMSYQVTPQLRLSFEAANLTDQPLRYSRDSQRDDTLLYAHSGRSFALGAAYKF
ncbi:TonB-dependent receptor [Aquabacterium sp. OR-4]|uniref:TonB-dependent receptor n=1 Tax=Aquabacterium sp. OR-4 TaxID=2978127 RepID=UPI0021B317B4|nr:TonB-dependent receptor [Aquabacterium sp. OR-4]MDT7837084.1 TonB-dependent receptor [Aquabacterium sp. OR-4]